MAVYGCFQLQSELYILYILICSAFVYTEIGSGNASGGAPLLPLRTVTLPSESTSTITESPSLMSRASIFSAMLSSNSLMIARLKGLAP
ncbi:hypothetical protein HanXRQr2_Chr05g0229661 [Helianthus annuus]|uniref:Uncharacterized protein n=1 Tax=Helianthus annuus TaxID=4232 RepID=A0A9K3J1M1_HELAN|nr:hypothetical protein HanXRQr2_Chr05g0229661 [Helianthus annuus]KAJ0923856.1 hypothetical protein HanPSC8_Chr05g0221571 [Helianthus annuus]